MATPEVATLPACAETSTQSTAPPVVENGEPPPWAQELGETVQKLLRAQARLGLKLEEIERKLEGGLEDLRGALPRAEKQSAEAGLTDVLDAIDLLCEVKGQPTLPPDCAAGLAGVVARLDRALAQAGLLRYGEVGQPADGARFRIVGTEDLSDLAEGVVTRLVRHAAMRGPLLIREGEVLVNRRSS